MGDNDAIGALGDFFDDLAPAQPKAPPPKKPDGKPELKLPTAVNAGVPAAPAAPPLSPPGAKPSLSPPAAPPLSPPVAKPSLSPPAAGRPSLTPPSAAAPPLAAPAAAPPLAPPAAPVAPPEPPAAAKPPLAPAPAPLAAEGAPLPPPPIDAAPEAPAAETEEAEVYDVAPKPKPQREAPPPKQWKCKAGKTIFREEESSFDIFILEEGKVEIVVAEERVAVVSTPGVVLGEVGALLRRPRSAAVKALTDCTFTVYRDFEALMAHDPDKLLEVARTLATRLADSNEKIEKVLGVLYQAKVKDEIVDNVSLVLRGKKPKPHQKQGFLAKLGLG